MTPARFFRENPELLEVYRSAFERNPDFAADILRRTYTEHYGEEISPAEVPGFVPPPPPTPPPTEAQIAAVRLRANPGDKNAIRDYAHARLRQVVSDEFLR